MSLIVLLVLIAIKQLQKYELFPTCTKKISACELFCVFLHRENNTI